MKSICLLTSGGDASGMNAAIRAATRTALKMGMRVLGSLNGYRGLCHDNIIELDRDAVRNILHRGGSIIYSTRCDDFMTVEGRARALDVCRKHDIDGLVLIGGDGTMRGAKIFMDEGGPPSVGLPGTIDNDIEGIDYTIGFDTAVNTAIRAIDQVRDTAETMERIFFIETMGRASGAIALAAGIAGGANIVVVPEIPTDIKTIAKKIESDRKSGSRSLLVIVSEGDTAGGAYEIAEKVKEISGIEYRVTVLGHTQRGGCPTAVDRINATVLGVCAVEDLIEGRYGSLIGMKNGNVTRVPFDKAVTSHSSLPEVIVKHADTMVT